MVTDLFFLACVAAALLAWADWRRGLYLLIVIGTLQDPVRKLTPGTPPILAIASLPVWLAFVVSAYHSDPDLWRRFTRAYPQASRIMRVFLVCLIPPVILVLSYGLGAWRLALLGSFAYVAPLAIIVVSFSLARDSDDVRRLLAFHAAYSALLLVGAWLEFLGAFPGSLVLGTEALGFRWVRTQVGSGGIDLISGLYRSPDLMAWHAATLVMGATALAGTRTRVGGVLWLLVAVWGGSCLLMAGRRKAIIMPILFVATLVTLSLAEGRAGRALRLVVTAGVVLASVLFAAGETAFNAGYLDYAASTATDAAGRFSGGTVGALRWTFLESGFLGRGVGSATQGAQHLLDSGVQQGWQESGASKVLAELGLPGLICGLWLGASLARAVLTTARSRTAPRGRVLQAALVGMLVANAASFTVSHQVFGDILVVTSAAALVGLALSAPRWSQADQVGSAGGAGTTEAARHVRV